jgi:hypothetical protein
MDGVDLGVRFRREERKDVAGRLALLDLLRGCPIGPDAGEADEGAARRAIEVEAIPRGM